MRVLWVEDNFTENKKDSWFASFGSNCEIVPVMDYNTAQGKIANELDHYDLIVLDINLENSNIGGHAKKVADHFKLIKEDFWREAGFHLFIQLLELGFPKERIVFFTGNVSETELQRAVDELRYAWDSNADNLVETILNDRIQPMLSDQENTHINELANQGEVEALFAYLEQKADSGDTNTYNQFKKRFHEARIQPPRAIKKGNNELVDLQTWGKKHVENPYLRLRRGIIDGCECLGSLTDNAELKEYFFGLMRYLPLIEPSVTAKESIYLHLARAIIHDWDDQGHKIPDRKTDPIGSGLGWTLRTARNWLAHDSLLKASGEQVVAFLFLLNARMLITLDNSKLEPFELKLLSLFTSDTLQESKITPILKQFYKETTDICEANNILSINRYYGQMINDIHGKKIENLDYYKLLLRSFMFAIYRQSSSFPQLANTNNPVSPYLDYRVKFEKLGKLPFYLTEFEKCFYPLSI